MQSKMKTETDVAKEYSDDWRKNELDFPTKSLCFKFASVSHLRSCRRFLDWLGGFGSKFKKEYDSVDYINYKIKDLKNAIKTYEDVGIK